MSRNPRPPPSAAPSNPPSLATSSQQNASQDRGRPSSRGSIQGASSQPASRPARLTSKAGSTTSTTGSSQSGAHTRARSGSRTSASAASSRPGSRVRSGSVPPASTTSSQPGSRQRSSSRPASSAASSRPDVRLHFQPDSRSPMLDNLSKWEVAKLLPEGWLYVCLNVPPKNTLSGQQLVAVHFWVKAESKDKGASTWKIESRNLEGVASTLKLTLTRMTDRNLDATLDISSRGSKIAFLVISRRDSDDPVKLQDRNTVIDKALRAALAATIKGGSRDGDDERQFVRNALLVLAGDKIITTPNIAGNPNLEPLYEEVDALIEDVRMNGNQIRLAYNSW
ncbi:hypothetical protein D9756_009339 [Leucocoprinus leucothites]|uniref:Uncharacterized protein n=1 Tax=Leucocoprinus leucothites TaxID=201217 RepID=A0A8H5FU30_9AGAR|nr:hypothetical protein D9756_009339 [Leucoagaricus leucothites]